MLIHVATDNDIHPPRFGATQRVFGLARGLARRHRVRALCVVPNRTRAPREETVAGVEIRRVKSWHTSAIWRLERWGLAPMFATAPGHRANAARYRAALGGGADVLTCDLTLAALLADGPRLTVYASHNVEAASLAASHARLIARGRWTAWLEALEREAVQRARLTLACSDEDAAAMRERYGARDVEVVPNGWDETAIAPPSPAARARARAALGADDATCVAAFVGGDWGPNREALAFLLERVFPALARDRVRLLVVGGVARAVAGRREPWLVARGPVDDLAAALAAADVGLNPVVRGGGSNVKVPTYLGAGLAVITTPFGLRGYGPLAPLVRVVEPDAFADALRERPAGWAARGEARPAALDDYAWGALGERLGDAFARRLAGAGDARGAA